MANIKSQIKRIRQNEIRRVRNKATKSELRTREKNAEAGAVGDDAGALWQLAQKRLDKAATKGVIHKNQAARRKSRLAKRIAKLQKVSS